MHLSGQASGSNTKSADAGQGVQSGSCRRPVPSATQTVRDPHGHVPAMCRQTTILIPHHLMRGLYSHQERNEDLPTHVRSQKSLQQSSQVGEGEPGRTRHSISVRAMSMKKVALR